ncbi:hypothetical protein FF38_07276 [Lucilia cuprina]|uniref:Uncharacterized protein n=1 Tax=Lucilia cuprina TaxID=7375 RepID=A0A0L0CGA8_LUCCU|nr:hypothetical protein FF38_07276 [Lucilia cuprina]
MWTIKLLQEVLRICCLGISNAKQGSGNAQTSVEPDRILDTHSQKPSSHRIDSYHVQSLTVIVSSQRSLKPLRKDTIKNHYRSRSTDHSAQKQSTVHVTSVQALTLTLIFLSKIIKFEINVLETLKPFHMINMKLLRFRSVYHALGSAKESL